MYSKSQLLKFVVLMSKNIWTPTKLEQNETISIVKPLFTQRERKYIKQYIQSRVYKTVMICENYGFFIKIVNINNLRDLIYLPKETFFLRYWPLNLNEINEIKTKVEEQIPGF